MARYTVRMYSKVKILRRGGERKPDQEIARDDGFVGHVSLALIENIAVMTLHAPMDGGKRTPVVPRLWRARLVTMNGDRMLMQGFERLGNQDDPAAPVQKQEWAIQVMVDQPEYIARTAHRPAV